MQSKQLIPCIFRYHIPIYYIHIPSTPLQQQNQSPIPFRNSYMCHYFSWRLEIRLSREILNFEAKILDISYCVRFMEKTSGMHCLYNSADLSMI